MIGQTKLLEVIDKLVESDFPRFVMLVGKEGSGKKLLCREIANKLKYPLVPIGTGVDEIREVITNSYRNTEPIVYVIPDTDKMSLAGKNALLKITEEPPQKAYFIMTVTDTANTLQTLTSRACVLKMNYYTEDERRQYLQLKYDIGKLSEDEIDFIIQSCYVPQEIDVLMGYDLKEFKKFIETVCSSLHKVSSANSFKIEQRMALKKDEDKWDVLLVLQAIKVGYRKLYMNGGESGNFGAYMAVMLTIHELMTKNSVNKQYCLDQMILQIRKCWR